MNPKLANPLLYTGVSVIVFFIFALQINSSGQASLIFLIVFLMLFFAISELFNNICGLYAATLSVALQLLSGQSPLIAFLQILIIIYYFLIKALRDKKLEETSANEKYFRRLVNISLQPIIIKNKKGEIVFASESIRDLLNHKKNNVIGKHLSEYIHPEDVNRFQHFFAELLKFPNEKRSIEYRIKKGEENWIWIRNDAINLLNQGDTKAIVSSIQDITFQKELDREKADIINQEKTARATAEKAVRDRDEFLSIASHELKTPLTTVLLQLQATLRKISTQSLADFSGGELLNSLQIAEKQSQNLSNLIKDLLNISVASTGRLTLSLEKVNLSALVEHIPQRYAEEIKLATCPVTVTVEEKEIVGTWDQVRIEQAISNLFLNALKYSAGKKVSLTLKREGTWAILKIKDQGKGIPKDMQSVIFEPFRRVSNDASGLGVGLFIAKRIAFAHNGDIEVESEEGKGATFILKLPLNKESTRA